MRFPISGKLAINLLLYALPLLAAFAGNSTNVEPQVVRDIRTRLPAGWNCTVYQSNDVKVVPHGLGNPVFQVVVANTNLSFVKSKVPQSDLFQRLVELAVKGSSRRPGQLAASHPKLTLIFTGPVALFEHPQFY